MRLRPEDFAAQIDHPYWPMRPGTTWHYVERNASETQHATVRVTHRTKLIKGVRARVVRDIVRSGGEVVEDTRDWYAQDSGGSVWYLGEATAAYENGQIVSHAGLLPRRYWVAAEDRALILSRREAIKTPTGFHRHMLHTSNSTPLERSVLENKFYARGIGPVLEIDLSPSFSRAVLVRDDRP